MKQLYLDILAKAALFVDSNSAPRFKHIAVFNNQINRMKEAENYSFADPALFVAISNPKNFQQLGNGGQLLNDLIVTFYIYHRQEDAGDGSLDQNLDALQLKEDWYQFIQKFQPNMAHPFVRVDEREDADHDNAYVYEQDYKTNYTILSTDEPVNGVTKNPPTDLEIDVTVDGSQNPQPHTYN